MLKWFKKQNSTVKGMIILAILMIIGIILRWDYIKSELALTFDNMFSVPSKTEQVDTTSLNR